ncbi:hypothetical protein PUMCH_003669 [Australozyma saopauloensis]|uniref:RING-type domain-containing protein n=1 Tax=Australozyma saopauloensis TaxID=291208 RepID=A0AAX4HCJ0_9ASCO|nr:hypothetical protein PUMCH_003669 [[Candida] saopauloensis]
MSATKPITSSNVSAKTESSKTRAEGRKNRAAKKNQNSINHLLDFLLYKDLPEYRQQDQSNRRTHQRMYNNGRSKNSNLNYNNGGYGNGSHSGTHGSSKDYNNRGRPARRRPKAFLHGMRFINVNYKFVVDYRKSYTAQKLDPNVPVDTDDILCIVAPQGNACPICLSSELVAPRMITLCGHILCLPCLLALLDSEVPTSMKRESKAVVEKYTDCPLCASIIRRGDVKPVLVDTTDVRFDMPKVNDEIVLTLMARDANKIVPVPSFASKDAHGQFPWADQLHTDPYLRIYKADHTYVTSMYEQEKTALRQAYENDSDLFLAGRKLLKLALLSIDLDVRAWTEKFESEAKVSEQVQPIKPSQDSAPNQTFYYYQTGFKCPTTYVLSALDMKVLKTSYGADYSELPPSIVAKVENIRYEEMDEELATTRYKYISHLPLGTSLGFLECCWENNEFISPEVWGTYKHDLLKRSKTSSRKLNQEERSKQRALNEEERRAREYIDRENNGGPQYHEDDLQWINGGGIGSLTITDHREMPALSGGQHTERSRSLSADASELTQRSVWGTQIPKAEQTEEDSEGGWDADEMIRRAREEIEKLGAEVKGKAKKKKKYIILLSNTGWA